MNEGTHTTYMTNEIGPLPFCPGCGHSRLLVALNAALVRLQLDPHDIVIVTDIGCIGLADRYYTTNAFHGLHGRSITYASGLKLARPELEVIVLMGDGGCGIGGAHLLNVARRNIGLTLLVANNLNYGMTGGQHSVTTPSGGITATTPLGNIERPMDLSATAQAAGASWVYRATMFDKDLAETIAAAISRTGFSMVEVLELCTAYYMPKNEFKKPELLELFGGLAHGLLVNEPRPEYSRAYRDVYAEASSGSRVSAPLDPVFENSVDGPTGILIAGSAGRKVRSAATNLARAAILSGLFATQKDDYPITVQTGHSMSEILISPERIEFTAIERPAHVVLLSEEGLSKTRAILGQLGPESVAYVDESLVLPSTRATVVRLPFEAESKSLGKHAGANFALAAFLEMSGLFPIEAFAEATERFQSRKVALGSLTAMLAGRELARKFGAVVSCR